MAIEPFRFLHAGDFHLELPVEGLEDVPEHLRSLLLDAPFKAVENVFDTALVEEVDFVLLAGDVLDPLLAGPFGLTFLVEQFEKLFAAGIPVYWIGGRVDPPGSWPDAIDLPLNVHYLAKHDATTIIHERGGQPLCAIVAASSVEGRGPRWGEFRAPRPDLFTIGLAYGLAENDSLAKQNIQYWALGGDHRRKTPLTSPMTAHWAGSPQGRSPDEPGPHGCTVVYVDAEGRLRLQHAQTDVLRWHNERVNLHEEAQRSDIERLLRERSHALRSEAGARQVLVSWRLVASGRLAAQLQRQRLADELLATLRRDVGMVTPGVYAARVDLEPPAAFPAPWYEEDTILGDFLRSVRELEQDDAHTLDLAPYLSPRHREGLVGQAALIAGSAERRQVLREAATLGVEQLRGDEAGR